MILDCPGVNNVITKVLIRRQECKESEKGDVMMELEVPVREIWR